MLGKLPIYSINHDKSRREHIYKLSADSDLNIMTSKASDGSEWWDSGVSLRHPWGNEKLTPGMMGCAKSHLNLFADGSKGGVVIFEDDAELVLSIDCVHRFVDDVVKHTDNKWDIILLGANEYVNSMPITQQITRVYRFWGTHAMIVHRDAFQFIKKTFNEAIEEGIFLPADWMYNEAIRQNRMRVFAPSSPKLFFRQIPGLVSAITGKIRD
jgi:GR25 family glycosyltransferase involved in LPS biosynthesis